MSEDDLKGKTIRNISYNAAGKAVTLALVSISNIILARILVPNDYGIVAFANVIVGLLWLFNDFGVNTAVVQKPSLGKKDLYTAFSVKIGLGCAAACVGLIMAPLATFFFDNADVVNVIRVLCANFILAVFCFIPGVLMTRELEYKQLTVIAVVSTASGTLVSIIMAIAGYRYWSLVGSVVMISIVNAILYNVMKPVRIKISYDHRIAKNIMIFGGSVLLSRVVIYGIFNSDNFIIGALNGADVLGYYALAFNWGAFVCTLASSVVLSVLFPTFSRIQGDRKKLCLWYLAVIEKIAFFGVVSYVILFVVAREFLIEILGGGTDKWMQSSSCLRIFCAYGLIRILLEPIGSVCMAIGKPGTILKANLLAVVFQIAFIYPVLKSFGIEGVAVLVTVAYSLQYFIYVKETYKQIGLKGSDVVERIWSSLILIPVASLAMLDKYHEYTMVWLIGKVVLTAVICVSVHGVITKWKLEKEVRVLLASRHTA
jgi:lipopolysaccharide exporter